MISALLYTTSSCIDRYYLDNTDSDTKKFVVEGTITDNCDEQVIKVSYTSSTEMVIFIPGASF